MKNFTPWAMIPVALILSFTSLPWYVNAVIFGGCLLALVVAAVRNIPYKAETPLPRQKEMTDDEWQDYQNMMSAAFTVEGDWVDHNGNPRNVIKESRRR